MHKQKFVSKLRLGLNKTRRTVKKIVSPLFKASSKERSLLTPCKKKMLLGCPHIMKKKNEGAHEAEHQASCVANNLSNVSCPL